MPDLARLRSLVGQSPILFLDEAQRIPDIGLTLKLLIDHFPGLQILVTGSSALELADRVHEPLTGRKWEFVLFPLCWQELVTHHGPVEARRQLETRLLYGMYPEVVSRPGMERDLLLQLSGDNLTRDLLAWQGIRKPELLGQLLQALALQVGSMVSTSELANLLKVSRATVAGYLDLLEKCYIIFTLPSWRRNRRDELSSSRKVYFWDNGIRNALLDMFQPLDMRADTGRLWENFLVSERRKRLAYAGRGARLAFWRTHGGAEIDLLEEEGGVIRAWEFKWNTRKRTACPASFRESYPAASFSVVQPDTLADFLLES